MKKSITLLFAIAIGIIAKAQLASTKTGNVSFFSTTPVENIEGVSHKTLAVINTANREIAIIITNTTFEFPNKLMEEHFNEKYMESEKYPQSTFKGKINESIDLTKDGEYKVSTTGKLKVHGVEQDRTIAGTIVVNKGEIKIVSDFQIKLADHKVEIPKLVLAKIAEIIDVKLNMILIPKK